MKKNGSVKLGETKCDFCGSPATYISGIIVACEDCAFLVKSSCEQTTLKSAGLTLRDLHR